MSLVNAFEVPVRPTEQGGLTTSAIKALGQHYTQLVQMYGLCGAATCAVLAGADADAAQPLQQAGVTLQSGVPALLENLRATLNA